MATAVESDQNIYRYLQIHENPQLDTLEQATWGSDLYTNVNKT